VHAVLIKYHVMLTADPHSDLMPIPAPPGAQPNPWHPHLVGHVLWGWTLGDIAPKTQALGIEIIRMGSDIANGIPHIPLPPTHFLLAVMYTAFSGSKSHFGPSTVHAEGKPIGAAILVIVNVNLNCCDSVPLPIGWVCAPNTVMTSLSFGDILGGLFAMAVDAALQYGIGKVTGAFGETFKSNFGQLLADNLAGFMLGSPLGKSALDVIKAVCPDSWGPTLDGLSYIPGFPGYAGTWSGAVSDGARSVGQGIGDGVAGLFGSDGAAAANQAPSVVNQPATGTTPTPMDGATNNPSVEDL
jgi:hypothetical protein